MDESVLFGNDIIITVSGLEDLRIAVITGDDIKFAQDELYSVLSSATMVLNPSSNIRTIGIKENTEEAYISDKFSATVISAYSGPSESTTDNVYICRNAIADPGDIRLSEHDNELICRVTDFNRNDILKRKNEYIDSFDGDFDTVEIMMDITKTKLEKGSRNLFIDDDADMGPVTEEILNIQTRGLAKRMQHTGAKKLMIGISGGLDSCLTLIVSVRTADLLGLSRKDVVAVTLPSFGTTARTRSNAQIICEELGVDFREINIGNTVLSHFKDIGHAEDVYDSAYENAQARERTQVLMDIANMENGIVVGTGDLSELALGWATYNGDQMSNYGVNGDIPKTVIQRMIREIAGGSNNEILKKALLDIVDTPISPELVPGEKGDMGHKTEDLVGPYELHDYFIYNILKYGYMPSKIKRMAVSAFEGIYDEDTIGKWLTVCYRRFISQQFKRSAIPDGPKVFDVGLSPRGGYMIPSDASSFVFTDELRDL